MKSLRRILFGFHGAPGQVGCIQHPTLSRHRRAPLLAKCWLTAMVVVAFDAPPGKSAEASLSAAPYLHAARQFADRVVTDGRDSYGNQKTPLFVDGLHAETLEPVRWKKDGETWVLSNFASQQPLIRLLDGLTALTGNPSYRQAADAAARHVLENLRTPNGLLHWGGHSAWDLQEDKAVAHSPFLHEMKGQQPHYRLMHRLDPAATTKLMEMIWT